MTFSILLVFSYLLRLVPTLWLLVLGDILGSLFYFLLPIRKHVVMENLAMAFVELSPRGISSLVRKNYQHYGRVLIELIRSLTWKTQDYHDNIQYHGLGHIEALRRNGRGAFLLTLHIGNWELAIGATAALGLPLSAVVKKGTSKFFRNLQERYRGRQGVILLEETKTATDVLRLVRQGGLVAFVLDQFMGPPIGLPVRFFGREAGTAASLALLTERYDADVILAYSHRDSDGQVHMTFDAVRSTSTAADLAGKLIEKTQFYNDTLERIVRAYPVQWMWLHRRWKTYNGVPRWKIKATAFASFLVAMALLSCSTQPVQSPTGIVVPADRVIEIPKFAEPQESPPASLSTPVSAENIQSTIEPIQMKKRRGSGKPVLVPTPIPTPAPVFMSIPSSRIPFEVGERMEVDLSWMALPAGRAVLEVRAGPLFNGRLTKWLWGNVLSSKLIDTIYHLDNTIESFVDYEGLIPYKFLLHMVETHQKKETRVLFDHPQKKAYYWAKRISQKWGNMDLDRVDELVPTAKDMFSALYFSRLLEYQLGRQEKINVFENGQNWEIELNPVANELIKSKVGIFQCWKLMIKMRLNNILTQTGDIALWLSDDSKRYLVKFDAKVKIGSLIGTLVGLKEKS